VIFTIRTGPPEFSKRIVTKRMYGGLLPSGMEIKDGVLRNYLTKIPTPEEEDFFKAIGLPWIDPEDRK
jgi:hypothetical protein